MSDDIAKKTAEDFRLLGGQEPRPKPADPFNNPAPVLEPGVQQAGISSPGATPSPTPDEGQQAPSGAAAVEAAMERALGRVLAKSPGGGLPSAEITARLDEMKARAGERDDELAFELRNGLPGRIRREIHEQLRPAEERLAALEKRLDNPPAKGSRASRIASAVLYAVLTGVIVAGLIIFERPLRHWGQDTIFPLVGMSLPVAPKASVPEKKAPPLGDR